jgi:GNAT superfamily N-acetyltransferase
MPASDHVNRTEFTTIFHPANPKEMGGFSSHTLEAWAPEHADTPWAREHPSSRMTYAGSDVDPGIKPLGSIGWHHKTGEIKGVYTRADVQRQGIATDLLHQGRSIAGETRGVPLPKHSPFRTTEGDAWAKSLGDRLPRRSVT